MGKEDVGKEEDRRKLKIKVKNPEDIRSERCETKF